MQPNWSELIRQVNALLTPVREIVIILRPNPNLDSLAAGLATTASLQKIGRRATLVCPTGTPPEIKKLEGPKEILATLPQNQVEITINYQQGSLEKIESEKGSKGLKLNLIAGPNQSAIEPISIDHRQFTSQLQAAILLELENLAHLQDFYNDNQPFFNQTPLINVDYHANNARYGRVNLIDPQASSISEMVTLMLYDLRMPIDKDSAENLYQGIGSQTSNFEASRFSANLLEAASICLRYQKAGQPLPDTTPTASPRPPQPTASPQPPPTPTPAPTTPSSWPQTTTDWPKK